MNNNNLIIENIKSKIEKIFASRCKAISPKSLDIWVNDIVLLNYPLYIIDKVVEEYMNDDEIVLTLPNLKKMLYKHKNNKIIYKKTFCPYCNGTGYVFAVKFNSNNELINCIDTALGCVCGNNRDNSILKMDENPQKYHKTILKNGDYYLVFKDIIEKSTYLANINKNIISSKDNEESKDYDFEEEVPF